MAYAYDPNLTEEERRQQQDAGAQAAAAATPGAAPAPQRSASTGGTQSGQFTNLQSYLNANKGQQFGSQVAGKVQGDVDTANKTQQEAGQEFGKQATAGTVNYNEGLAGEVKTGALGVQQDDAKRSEFEKMRDANYGGPRDLTDVGDSYLKSTTANQNAQKAAEATTTESGQKSLLHNYYGRPTYSRGETNLDQFLIQNDQSAKPKFEQARQGAGQLESNFNTLKEQLAAVGQQAADTTQATRNRVASEFLGDEGEIARQRKVYEDRAEAENARIKKNREAITQNKAVQDDLRGLTTFGQDLNQFLTNDTATASNMLNSQEAANFGALNQLLQQQSGLDLSQAGSYGGGDLKLNQQAYDEYKKSQDAMYNNLFTAPEYTVDQYGVGSTGTGTDFTDPRLINAAKQAGFKQPDQLTFSNAKKFAGEEFNNASGERYIKATTGKSRADYLKLMEMINQNLGRNTKLS